MTITGDHSKHSSEIVAGALEKNRKTKRVMLERFAGNVLFCISLTFHFKSQTRFKFLTLE